MPISRFIPVSSLYRYHWSHVSNKLFLLLQILTNANEAPRNATKAQNVRIIQEAISVLAKQATLATEENVKVRVSLIRQKIYCDF